jgi:hypothetical protein
MPSEVPKSPLRFSKAVIGPWTPLPDNARPTVLAKQLHDYERSFADVSRMLRGKRPRAEANGCDKKRIGKKTAVEGATNGG